jgi:hypothetical protein
VCQVGTDSHGMEDPNHWNIVLRSSGCPEQLLGKTCIQWGKRKIWIHDQTVALNGPCTRCAHSLHTAKECVSTNVMIQANVINIAAQVVNISDVVKPAVAMPFGTNFRDYFEEQMTCILERGKMEAEDRNVKFHAIPKESKYYTLVLNDDKTGRIRIPWFPPAVVKARQAKEATRAKKHAIELKRLATEEKAAKIQAECREREA